MTSVTHLKVPIKNSAPQASDMKKAWSLVRAYSTANSSGTRAKNATMAKLYRGIDRTKRNPERMGRIIDAAI